MFAEAPKGALAWQGTTGGSFQERLQNGLLAVGTTVVEQIRAATIRLQGSQRRTEAIGTTLTGTLKGKGGPPCPPPHSSA